MPEVNFETGELFLSNAPPHRCQRYRGLGFRVEHTNVPEVNFETGELHLSNAPHTGASGIRV